MKLMIVGASRGLGRAFVEGLCSAGDSVIGVSRRRPNDLILPDTVSLDWIEADFGDPLKAALRVEEKAPLEFDVLIYNLGVWEESAFSDKYNFLDDIDESIDEMINTYIAGANILLKRLITRLLISSPQ